ncbi:MAG TPA: hypothetical protein PLG17_09420, partial [Thermodesulfobacteriota bacterium]|nr:hypothetical protein [Thermodesulfobacteriota bacterium]
MDVDGVDGVKSLILTIARAQHTESQTSSFLKALEQVAAETASWPGSLNYNQSLPLTCQSQP